MVARWLGVVVAVTMAAWVSAPTASAEVGHPSIKADLIAAGHTGDQVLGFWQVPDGAAVTVTNSFQQDGDIEQTYAGPVSAQVDDGVEFEGFGGFDIDVSSDMIYMDWSTEAKFDEFEGTFDAGFRDIFTFELPGLEFEAEVDESATLVPDVSQEGTTIRVVFSEGMRYADGQNAIIELIDKSEPDDDDDGADGAGDGDDDADEGTGNDDEGEGEGDDDDDAGEGEGDDTASGDDGDTDDTDEADDDLPATGPSTLPATLALALLGGGAVLTIGSRRSQS